jgi:hypothetical protein
MLVQLFSLGDAFKPAQAQEPEPMCRKRARDDGATDTSQTSLNAKQWDAMTHDAPAPGPFSANPGQVAQMLTQPHPSGNLFMDTHNGQFNWDWELSSLLLSQFGHPNPSVTCDESSAHQTSGYSNYESGPGLASSVPPEHQAHNALYSGLDAPDPNAMSIWMNAPAAFG